jgi:carbamoyltransferase
MKVLGISGLENAVHFKKTKFRAADEREYRISQGHDSAAALIVDGKIVAAAAEERFNRVKHSGAFPIGAIRYCLEEGGLDVVELDEIAHSFNYSAWLQMFSMSPESAELYQEVFSREALLRLVERDLPPYPLDRVTQVDHHLAHAASAYFTSGWDQCLVVVIDGMGEMDGATVYSASNGTLKRIHRVSANNSIGIFYSLVTLHLGFDFNSDEYKIMGLAPYGAPSRFRDFFSNSVLLGEGGSFSIPPLQLNKTPAEQESYLATRRWLADNLVRERQPDEEIAPIYEDVAAALQECLDKTLLHLCGHFARKTGLRRLAMAGGVALNCTANGKLLESGLFDEIYVQPAAGDDGSALGAALFRASRKGAVNNIRMPVPFLGPAYSIKKVDAALRDFGDRVTVHRFKDITETAEKAAELIAGGRVIAWYRGRMEFGPRALGHRSILADPGRPEMRDRINAMVKMREAFRPFAPAVTIEDAPKWFHLLGTKEQPYMIMTVNVREEYRRDLPAVTHVNGSARVQTVSKADSADFHCLLKAIGRATGREIVLNTSFNVKGQPMVNTPQEALETYLGTGIDHLFIENLLITRSDAQERLV